jgi:DNA-directed RNA polymerase subunit N (RpoN/RPB10)
MSRIPLTTGLGLSLRGLSKTTRPPPTSTGKSAPGTPQTPQTPTRTPINLPLLKASGSRSEELTTLPGSSWIGQEGEEELGPPGTPSEQCIQSVQTSRRVVSSAQEKLAEFPPTFTELDLMPMSCFSHGKIIRQLDIEDALMSGRTLKEAMEELGYKKLCCRQLITGAPSIIKLQKELESNPRYNIESLRLEDTDIESVSSFGLTGFIRSDQPSPQISLTVVEEAPPGTILGPSTESELCFTGQGESLVPYEPTTEDSYEQFMSQIEQGDEED